MSKEWKQNLKEIIKNWSLYPDDTTRYKVLEGLIKQEVNNGKG